MEFDTWLAEFINKLEDDDLLIITADHGCDPTYKGSDHTREAVPMLVYQRGRTGKDLGIRQGFWDVAATIAAHLGVDYKNGTSAL
jgi:phosphopentomutase